MADLYRNKYRIPSARADWWDYGRDAAYFVTICTHNRQHFFGDVENGKMVLNELGILTGNVWQMISTQFPFVRLEEWVVMPNHIHGIITIDRRDAIHRVSEMNNTDTGKDAIHRVSTIDGTNPDIDAMNRVSEMNDTDAGKDAIHRVSEMNDTDAGRDAIHRVSEMNDTDAGKDAMNRVSTMDGADPKIDAMNRVSTGGATGNTNPMLYQNLSTIVRWFKGRTTFETRKIHADFAWQTRFHEHIIRNAKKHEKIRYYIINNPLLWDKDKFNSNSSSKKSCP